MIKAVILDFDDTLIQTHKSVSENIKFMIEKMDLPNPNQELYRNEYGKSQNDIINAVWPDVDKKLFDEGYFSFVNNVGPYPAIKGVHGALDLLSGKYVLGIVTGSSKNIFMDKIIRAGIDIKKFSFIFTQDEIGKSKSETGYFDPVFSELSKLGISKEEVLFVGDSVHDHEITKNAGIHFAGVLTGPTTKQDLLEKGIKENLIIPSIMELPHFIENNGF